MKLRMVLLIAMLSLGAARMHAQASAIPSAQGEPGAQTPTTDSSKAKSLLDAMVKALGGEAWLNREDWIYYGRTASFYKGQPHEGAPEFEEYYRAKPFAERVILVSHYGVFIATDHKDIAEVWTDAGGTEITFKGTKPLPAKDVEDYERRRRHSLEVIVNEWLKQPGVVLTYGGSDMVERRLAEQIDIMTTNNDAVTLQLDESTHLPLSISFQWRDPLYKDLNTDVQEFDD